MVFRVRLRTLKLIGILLLAASISGFITSLTVIGYIQLAAVFGGWILASIVLVLVSTAGGISSNPVSLIRSYRYLVRQVLEETGLHDINPYFLPSQASGAPSMYISTSSSPTENIPKRLFVFQNSLGVRLETLGSYLLDELGGVGSGLSSAEAFLKSVLKAYLELAKDVEAGESGDTVVVRISKYIREVVEDDPPPVNIYVQIIGPVLAEALARPIRLENISVEDNGISLRFSLV